MTEAEWLTDSDPEEMLKLLAKMGNHRKLRLFACACAHRVWASLQPDFSNPCVTTSEQFADGKIDVSELAAARAKLGAVGSYSAHAFAACVDVALLNASAVAAALGAARSSMEYFGLAAVRDQITPENKEVARGAREGEAREQVANVLDIFGNPFRPVTLDRRWQTSTVVDLAGIIYDERAFDRMPILADALMDAGCDSEVVIAHCHQSTEHARGCWVVDLILSKDR